MIENLGQATHKLLHKQGQNYLNFIVFIVKVVYNMEMGKRVKLPTFMVQILSLV